MSELVKRRGDTAGNIATFTPALRELIIDITNNRVIVGDGVTAGGWPAAKLSEVVLPTRTAVSDANYTILITDRSVAYIAITAARTVSLPASTSYATGMPLTIFDESGAASATKTITVYAAGTDKIDGASSAVISSAYGYLALQNSGAGKWTIIDQATSNLGPVGIGTAADPNNPLSVYGASALFNSAGSFSFTINKAASTNTASVLFQDGFSGRAQIGLIGDDNFRFKVSSSGSTFYDALDITATSGLVTANFGFALAGSASGTTTLQAAAAASGTLTLPAVTDTLVGQAATQTLTNKTLTAPVIAGGTIDNAAIGGTTPAAAAFTTVIATTVGATTAIAVASGGTGGATASAARSSLGVAASGANTDITSLGALASVNGGPLAGLRNRLRNANFAINQRAVSGTVTLAAGAYGHDGVKGGASGATYTFATSGIDTVLTITAGSLILPIESTMIEGGVYAVSQAGTAQARVWQGTGSTGSGSYAAVPFSTSSLTAATQTNVEFSTGTVSRVQFELGTVATAFERRPLSVETVTCERYFQQFGGTSTAEYFAAGVCGSSFAAFTIPTRVRMRAAPTLTIQNLADIAVYDGNANIVPSGVTYSNVTPDNLGFGLTCSGLTYGRGAILSSSLNTSALIQASSEL